MAGRSSEGPHGGAGEADRSASRYYAEVVIRNRKGLHARASAQFVKCAENFDAQVQVSREGQTVLGTSIMGLMMLGAAMGNSVLIETKGPEARAALDALVALIENGFGEAS